METATELQSKQQTKPAPNADMCSIKNLHTPKREEPRFFGIMGRWQSNRRHAVIAWQKLVISPQPICNLNQTQNQKQLFLQ